MIEKEIWQRFRDDRLKVFAIGVKENCEQASFWSSWHRITYPVIIDSEGEIYQKYGIGSVPYHVLIDRNFIVCLSEINFNKDHLVQILNKHLK